MYQILAKIYDQLVFHQPTYDLWVSFTKKYAKGDTLLELASGNGYVANALSKSYHIVASDLNQNMMDLMQQKYPQLKTIFLDLNDLKLEKYYDTILCYCDSINYIKDYETLEKTITTIYNQLSKNGKFLFDMHHPDCVIQYQDANCIEGSIDGIDYEWIIQYQNNQLLYDFQFTTNDGIFREQHIQTIFSINKVVELLEKVGFQVQWGVDFDMDNKKMGDKVFVVCTKGGK